MVTMNIRVDKDVSAQGDEVKLAGENVGGSA
jgi:hypothetical protein